MPRPREVAHGFPLRDFTAFFAFVAAPARSSRWRSAVVRDVDKRSTRSNKRVRIFMAPSLALWSAFEYDTAAACWLEDGGFWTVFESVLQQV